MSVSVYIMKLYAYVSVYVSVYGIRLGFDMLFLVPGAHATGWVEHTHNHEKIYIYIYIYREREIDR